MSQKQYFVVLYVKTLADNDAEAVAIAKQQVADGSAYVELAIDENDSHIEGELSSFTQAAEGRT